MAKKKANLRFLLLLYIILARPKPPSLFLRATNKTRGEKEKKKRPNSPLRPFLLPGREREKKQIPQFFFSPLFPVFFFSKKILDAGLFSFSFLMIMSLCLFFKLLLKGDQGRGEGEGLIYAKKETLFFPLAQAFFFFLGGLHLIPRPFCFPPLLHPTYGAGVEGAGRGGGEGHYIQYIHIHNIEEIIQNHFCKFCL